MLMVFFHPNEFAILDLWPQDTSITAADLVNNVILPLAKRHAQQLGISTTASCICIWTIPSATLLGISKDRWPAIGAFLPPYSPDLAIADSYRFVRLKQQLSERILDSEEEVPETIIEILSERPKDEVKRAFVHWKERCQ
jgi:hypothetical protein